MEKYQADQSFQKQYEKYVKQVTPTHNLALQMLHAFVTGGIICTVGQIILNVAKLNGLDDAAAGMTKSMNIVMPIMMGVITINVPIALGIYWTLSNLFSVLQTWATYKVLDKKEKKGELTFKEKKKPKKEEPKSTIVDRNKFTNQKGGK